VRKIRDMLAVKLTEQVRYSAGDMGRIFIFPS
jgi:hypothetical protein